MKRSLGLGCMRLSTNSDRDEGRAVAVITAALEAGARTLDTADVYGLAAEEPGHNERMVARALRGYVEREHVEIVTKGGLVHAGKRYAPNGKRKHLLAAAEASRQRLGVDEIDLYLLHAPDPAVRLETSVRALLTIKDSGVAASIGLCNVSRTQLERALAVGPIDAVQVELSPTRDESIRGGVLRLCLEQNIRVIAHSPFGGPRRARALSRNVALAQVASRHAVTPFEVALAWICDLPGEPLPLPGATRVETARRISVAAELQFDDDDRVTLDLAFVAGARLRAPSAQRRPPNDADGGVVLLMGMPGAGKSTAAARLEADGYVRLNRDLRSGSLASTAAELDRVLAGGSRRVVLDNTYATRAQRNDVVEVSWDHGVPVRCTWIDTPIEEAQINAVLRMLKKHERLLEPDEIAALGRKDPNTFAPRVQFRYRTALEPPTQDEGFVVERVAFERDWGLVWRGPRSERAAVFVDYAGVLIQSRSGAERPTDPDDVELLPGRSEALRALTAEGTLVLAAAWWPVEKDSERAQVHASVQRAQELLGLSIDTRICFHPAGPPRCWCRKPLPGLFIELMEHHRLAPPRCTLAGRSASDRTVAERLGMPYVEAKSLFDE